MRLGLLVAMTLVVAACADASGAAGDGDYMDDDIPMGMCGATGCETSGGVPIGFPCGGTNECSGDAVCVAPYADDEVGEFVCSAQCVPLDDESSWCLDSSACCDANAVCNARGLCLPGEGAVDSTGGDSSGTGTGDATSTSTGTGTGDATGSGSDTGDATGSGSGSGSGGAR